MTTGMLQLDDPTLHTLEPTPEEKREQLDRILHSPLFQGPGILPILLQYLVHQSIDTPEAQLKEYTIALEVFGRSSEFDPRTSSIVRVQAKRLRTKLQKYYEVEGRSDKILIDLPKGHYRVAFSYNQSKDESSAPRGAEPKPELLTAFPEAVTSLPGLKPGFTKAIFLAAIVIVTVVVALLVRSVTSSPTPPEVAVSRQGTADSAVVWSPFLTASTPTLMVLSNPPVFRFLNNSDAEVTSKKAATIPREQAQRLAEDLKDKLVIKQGGIQKLVLSTTSYTGIGEAIGLYHLTDFFRSAGKDVTLKQSRTVSAEDLKNHNVILLGSAWVNEWAGKMPVKEDFVYSINASILNTDPLPGEQLEYRPRYNEKTGQAVEDYALITVKPGMRDEHRLMILSGLLSEGTQGAAEYVTRKEYLTALSQRLQQMSDEDGPPKYYQVLLKVDVDNGIPTTVSILAIHPLKYTRH